MGDENILLLDKLRGDKVGCHSCIRRSFCPAYELGTAQTDDSSCRILHHKPIHQGQHVFRAGDEFDGFYVVRSGFFKSYSVDREGESEITGFYLPGEVFGLEGIETGIHNCNVKALDTGTLCKIPFSQFSEHSASHHLMTLSLLKIMGKAISRNHKVIFSLSKMNARQRFAGFLIDIVERFQQHGFEGKDLTLRMSRADIANYLGLAVETISRLFTRFQSMGILNVDRRYLQIYDMDALHDIVNENFHDEALLDRVG
ncbi:MAG: cyclic nucleotide-binding domain-containing protein [Pseudohongiellaceae bacterium]